MVKHVAGVWIVMDKDSVAGGGRSRDWRTGCADGLNVRMALKETLGSEEHIRTQLLQLDKMLQEVSWHLVREMVIASQR